MAAAPPTLGSVLGSPVVRFDFAGATRAIHRASAIRAHVDAGASQRRHLVDSANADWRGTYHDRFATDHDQLVHQRARFMEVLTQLEAAIRAAIEAAHRAQQQRQAQLPALWDPAKPLPAPDPSAMVLQLPESLEALKSPG